MTLDWNKHLIVKYNLLNLPSQVRDTLSPTTKTEFVYSSAGQKIKQRKSTGNVTLLYFNNIIYTLDGTANGIVVYYILTPEGRATCSGGAYTYEYFIKDHLGNTRVSFNVPSSTAVIVQQDDYYPFGMLHKPQVTSNDNKYLFNGKEIHEDQNLNWYDYGARFYDPQIARWTTIDPLAEKWRRMSPYNYTANNPIRFIDPDGMDLTDYGMGENGRIKRIGEVNSDPDRLFAIDDNGAKKDISGDGKVSEGDYVEVKDKTILPELANETNDISKSTRNIEGANDLANIFSFASDNSKPEWRFVQSIDNNSGSLSFTVGTKHDPYFSPSFNSLGIDQNASTAISSVHSHPGTPSGEERSSMGLGSTKQALGDWAIYRKNFRANNNRELYTDKVYFPNSKNLYQIGYYGAKLMQKATKGLDFLK